MTILRLFYWRVYYVKMCFFFWDIALISVCIGLSQFLEVKSRPRLNRISMFFFFCFLVCILACYPLSSLCHRRNTGSGAQPQTPSASCFFLQKNFIFFTRVNYLTIAAFVFLSFFTITCFNESVYSVQSQRWNGFTVSVAHYVHCLCCFKSLTTL